MDDDPIVYAKDAKAFEKYLAQVHESGQGFWLGIAKKGGNARSVSYAEAVEIALCWGWIDGQKKKLDENHAIQRFTPRRARSPWSKINVERVAQLTAAGRMQPAGMAEVERAKADGRWDRAYDPQSTMQVPDDFAAALEKNRAAAATFDALTKSQRFSFLYRIQDAKKPETRAARIEKFVGLLADGVKVI